MALITDPDDIDYELNTYTGTKELFVDLVNKQIRLTRIGALSTDGITLKAVYSKCKDIWATSTEAIKYPFPMEPITDEQFEIKSGWNFNKTGSGNDYTPNLIRTGGWAVRNVSGNLTEMWAGVITLGSIQAGGQVYYIQGASDTTTIDFNLTGAVNQAIQIFRDDDGDGNTSEGSDYDKRSYLQLFIREEGNTYATSKLSDIGVSGNMSYQVYRFPLTDADDTKITNNDATVSGYGITITWYGSAQARTINGTPRNFRVIVDGNNRTKEEIYEYVQYALRQTSDIDAGAGSKIGNVTNTLMYFIGSDLYTALDSTGGVFIDNYQVADTNFVHFTDDTGTIRNNARAATLTLNFGANLVADSSAIYRVFFTNDDAGDNSGADYGTANAITVEDSSSNPIAGVVDGESQIQVLYDFDNNEQRGTGSGGTNVPITAVAIGLATGQFVVGTGTIDGTTLTGSVSLVAAQERNYTA